MKRFVPFLAIFLISIAQLQGQQLLEIMPNPYEGSFEGVDLTDYWAEPVAHAFVTNVSDQTLSLRWLRVIDEAPAGWEFRVCDNVQCYSTNVATNFNPGVIEEPLVLEPGQTSILDLHILPRQISGECQVSIVFSQTSSIDVPIDTAFFVIQVPTSISEAQKSQIRLFPNPATDYLTLTNDHLVDEIVLYNVVGRRVRTFEVQPGKKYFVADLPDGVYMASLVNHKEGILRTIRVGKRGLRP